jgi:hypothetical protein
LPTWAAVLVAHGGNAGGAPCFGGEVTTEPSEGGDGKTTMRRGLVSIMSRI